MALRNFALTSFMGLNTETSDFLLRDNEASDLSNVDVDYRGYLRNRPGYSLVNAVAIIDAPHVLGLYKFYKDGITTPLFICAAGDKIYKLADSTWTDMEAALATTGGRWNFITHNNVCYGADDKNTPVKITATNSTYSISDWTSASIYNPPDAAPLIIVHRDRIFIAGDPTAYSTLRYTDTAATPDIDATGNTGIGILKGDGQKITGLAKLGFNLIVLKHHQIHHISGCTSADFVRRQILEGGRKGCYASRSLAKTGNTLIMLHDGGIINFNGTSVQDMSTNFKIKIDGIDDDYIQNACAAYKNNRYWLSYQTGETSNDKTLVIDAISGACTEYSYGVNCFYLDLDNNLYGACNSGFVRLLDTGTKDDTSDITSYWQSKYLDFGMPGVTKDLKEIVVYTSLATESFTFTFYVDQARQNWVKTVTPTSATLKEVRFSVNRKMKGKRFRLKIAHTGEESYKIQQIIFRYEPIAREGVVV